MIDATSTTMRQEQSLGRQRYLLVPRVIAGLPLLAIGLMHVVADG